MTSRGARYWSSGTIPLLAPDLLGDIIAQASDIALVISDLGQVLSVLVNPESSFGNLTEWEGRNIREVLTVESVAKLDERLGAIRRHEGVGAGRSSALARSIELNHVVGGSSKFPFRYSFHVIGPDGALLMLGRDLRPVAEMQQQLVRAQLALEADYEAQREIGARLKVLLEGTRDAMVFVSLGSGRIVDLNTAAAKLMGGRVDQLSGADFAQEFEGSGREGLLAALSGQAASDPAAPVMLATRRGGESLRAVVTPFRAAGERMLLCRLDPAGAPAHSRGPEARMAALYAKGVEGIVFLDKDGVITAANDAFLGMVDQGHATSVKGTRLEDYLARGQVDMQILMETAQRSGRMRLFSTRLKAPLGAEVAVEMSALWLGEQTPPCLALVVRDAGRADALRSGGFGGAMAGGEEGGRSAMELVGSATLKEIVAETTDVVEKMCIETAVELTGNNRVAAAEMLGLSRQSLYVKLRKYGLLARNAE